jgi:hypothetical protein
MSQSGMGRVIGALELVIVLVIDGSKRKGKSEEQKQVPRYEKDDKF